MNRAECRLFVGAMLAVLVPAASLEYFCSPERHAAGLTAAPFAWRRILVAHLTAAIPFGLACGVALRSRPTISRMGIGPWIVLGIAMPAIAGRTTLEIEGEISCLLVRSALAAALVVPWCVLAIAPRRQGKDGSVWIVLAVGAGLAIVPCGLYGDAVMAGYTREATDLMLQQRLQRAGETVAGLCELGSGRPVGSRTPANAQKWIAARLAELRREADRPLPSPARPSDRVDRAIALVKLERLDDAAELLRPIVPDDETASLMLAAIHAHRQRWPESDSLYRAILDGRLAASQSDPRAREVCRAALTGLAENARSDRRFADEEATLRRGVVELPRDASQFHFLLGRHYHARGQNGPALDELTAAVRLDPAVYRKLAEPIVQQIRDSTPSCLSSSPTIP